MCRMKTLGAAALAFAFVSAAAGADKPAKLRVLLLSGKNNHDWRKTTPALVKIFKDSGRFTVTVTNEPEKLKAADFKACDVIVSNWTPWPNIRKRFWDAETEEAFLDFIRGGRGLVVFHAASTAFATWPEFQKLVGATWGKGTGHGRQHEFEVKITDPKHPVTAGMKNFRIFDELWHRMPAQPGMKVLCTAFSAKNRGGSGTDEPVVMCTKLGKGRGFNLVLGHGTKAMSYPGWQKLMLRGTEWAATGKVKPPPAKKPARPAANTTATSTRPAAKLEAEKKEK
ncbi:MAG: ThuA domain-containing protein [Phycisphaerae bacterium]|nr:ThuA domain-containing protein [Phycisphaerae bacterium]